LTPSVQVGAAHFLPEHTPLAQSPATAQVFAESQGGQPPPQSTSVSVPFSTPFAQLAVLQEPAVQCPEAQSWARAHVAPFAHAAHAPPPQSTALSSWFFTRSVQVAPAHFPAVQT
jgi:hypothetical protein